MGDRDGCRALREKNRSSEMRRTAKTGQWQLSDKNNRFDRWKKKEACERSRKVRGQQRANKSKQMKMGAEA
ncbi:hypothetical protein NDU88_001103 [Pleurodeles waltl]|uniref:Uncharacterized protein n=1 Tax=Pleurodeles waltl TaxID=8319 RepID=A0AAV7U654_PLEWA|nr:hypothetical protein NDU88_001103 [Pleurodeles waltl]